MCEPDLRGIAMWFRVNGCLIVGGRTKVKFDFSDGMTRFFTQHQRCTGTLINRHYIKQCIGSLTRSISFSLAIDFHWPWMFLNVQIIVRVLKRHARWYVKKHIVPFEKTKVIFVWPLRVHSSKNYLHQIMCSTTSCNLWFHASVLSPITAEIFRWSILVSPCICNK